MNSRRHFLQMTTFSLPLLLGYSPLSRSSASIDSEPPAQKTNPFRKRNTVLASTSNSRHDEYILYGLLRKTSAQPFSPVLIGTESKTDANPELRAHFRATAACIDDNPAINPVSITYSKDRERLPLVMLNGKELKDSTAVFSNRDIIVNSIRNGLAMFSDLPNRRIICDLAGAFSDWLGSHSLDVVLSGLDPNIVLIADASEAGLLPSIIGTWALLSVSLRRRVLGVVLNSFLSAPQDANTKMLEAAIMSHTGLPLLGVIPEINGILAGSVNGLSSSTSQGVLNADFDFLADILGTHLDNRLF